MKFADIIGNKSAIETLRNAVKNNRIPHALLISGPAGIGKMRIARAFISYLNCENPTPDGDSCGICPACRQIDAFNHPDIHYVYPIYKIKSKDKTISSDYADEWKRFVNESPYMDFAYWMGLMNAGNSQPQISVEEAAQINVEAALSTFSARYKVFIIWLPEKIGLQAANKLLKIIEEPHDDTLFICVSNDPGSILPTIFSRLQRIETQRPSKDEISGALTARGISPSTADTFARLSEGSLLRAFQYAMSEGETGEFGEIFRSAMRYAFAKKVESLKALADRLSDLGREKALRLLDYFARMTRENFIANLCVPPLNIMTPDEEAFSSKFAPFINVANVEEILKEIDEAKRDISRNANSKIVWFDFFIKLLILIRKKPN